MITKPLSAQTKFKSSLTLVSEYSSNPGVNGLAEIAIYRGKQKTVVWSWNDEWGSECIASFSPKATVHEIVSSLLNNELMTSSVYPNDVGILNDTPPLGELLRLIWCEDEDNKKVAALLLHFSESTLVALCAKKGGLINEQLHEALLRIDAALDESSIEVDDLPFELEIAKPTPAAISKKLKATIQKAESVLENQRATVTKSLAPYANAIEAIVQQWGSDKHPVRIPGGGLIPHPTIPVLRAFLNDYALSHDSLPVGTHTVKGITKVINSSGTKVEFVVDFDSFKK